MALSLVMCVGLVLGLFDDGTALRFQVGVNSDEPVDYMPSTIEDGIFWSNAVEATLPLDSGFSDDELRSWQRTVEQARHIEFSGEHNCGDDPRDRPIKISLSVREFDGTGLPVGHNIVYACGRYSDHKLDVHGTLYSQQLAHELGLLNVVPVVAIDPSVDESQSAPRQRSSELVVDPPTRVVLVSRPRGTAAAHAAHDSNPHQFHKVYVPVELRTDNPYLFPDNAAGAVANSVENARRLAQWTDMIVFDYIVGYPYRMVNQIQQLQTDNTPMVYPVRSCLEDAKTGLLVFSDNEESMTYGYDQLLRFQDAHKEALHAHCVFRRATVENVRRLSVMEPAELSAMLHTAVARTSPQIPASDLALPLRTFETLKQRLLKVSNQTEFCAYLFQGFRS